jgi:hypothetical protein
MKCGKLQHAAVRRCQCHVLCCDVGAAMVVGSQQWQWCCCSTSGSEGAAMDMAALMVMPQLW